MGISQAFNVAERNEALTFGERSSINANAKNIRLASEHNAIKLEDDVL